MEIRVAGLNHKRAPVELREKLAVADAALPQALMELQKEFAAEEMVILSTCNRVELYTVHSEPVPDAGAVATLLARRNAIPIDTLMSALYFHRGEEAVRHLFNVTSSLDSMVPGETQIIGQVKDAYLAAKETGTTGRILNRLFQHALYVAKRVHTGTTLAEKNVSVPAVAARLAEKIFQDLSSKRLIIIGAGETGELAVAAFRNRGLGEVHVVNRTIEKARALAERWGGKGHSLDDLSRVLPSGDIVIGCVAADSFVLSPADVRAALEVRRREPMFFIDIAVPRSINPEVNALDNVYLYNIDDLESIVQQNLLEREQEVRRCAPLIEEETRTFLKEMAPPDVTALLTALREKLQSIGDEESRRTLARLRGLPPDQQEKEVMELSRRIVNKILHPPSETLREGAMNGQSHIIIELVHKLFGIK